VKDAGRRQAAMQGIGFASHESFDITWIKQAADYTQRNALFCKMLGLLFGTPPNCEPLLHYYKLDLI
jgi:hypothetical protein